jgi:predicted MPP superfamily phosphohydrolase
MIWIVLILCLMALLIRAYRNTFHPTVTNVSIPVKSAGIANFRILHLSDLHMENLSVSPERVVAECAGQTLDLIVITGDLLDRELTFLAPYNSSKRSGSCNPPWERTWCLATTIMYCRR